DPADLQAAFIATTTFEADLGSAIAAYNLVAAKTPASATQNLSETSAVSDFDTALTDLAALQPAIDTSSFVIGDYTETVGTDIVWKQDPDGSKKALAALSELVSQQTTDGLNFSTQDHQVNQ